MAKRIAKTIKVKIMPGILPEKDSIMGVPAPQEPGFELLKGKAPVK